MLRNSATESDEANHEQVSDKPSNTVVRNVAAIQAATAMISRELISDLGTVDTARCIDIISSKSACVDHVLQSFSGAMTSMDTLKKVSEAMEKRGYTADNTLYAQSVCPDEINHEPGDITDIFTKYIGEVFHLGGLAGIPFTGATGFGAFSHHVPDDGHCFVLMAPHIGLDESLEFGKYCRIGQGGRAGAACGAAVGAYAHCCSGKPLPDLVSSPNDYQMTFLMHQIQACRDEIMAAGDENAQQVLLANKTHDIAKEMLDNIVNVDFGGDNSTLLVLTGIQINMPPDFDDFFQPLNFYILDKQGGKTDLFEETFRGTGVSISI